MKLDPTLAISHSILWRFLKFEKKYEGEKKETHEISKCSTELYRIQLAGIVLLKSNYIVNSKIWKPGMKAPLWLGVIIFACNSLNTGDDRADMTRVSRRHVN